MNSEPISFEEALGKILVSVEPLKRCNLPLKKLHRRALAEPLIATADSPNFNNSAVDGYGVRCQDVEQAKEGEPIDLRLIGEIQAGSSADYTIEPGTTIKILTGARVPDSVEAVIMREYAKESGEYVSIERSSVSGENIRAAGGEYKLGEKLLDAGLRITPPIVGLIASTGRDSFPVHSTPEVTIVTTGDELVAPGTELIMGQIYDSNSFALRAAVKELGVKKCRIRHARDTKKSTSNAFKRAFENSDIVISSGGVSVGDYDYVKDVLEAIGVETVFWRIAIKPGKPVFFGILKDGATKKYVFGLPGNPVSSLVTFHQLVKPAILRSMGITQKPFCSCRATLTKDLHKRAGRLDFVRGIVVPNNGSLEIAPTVGQDSHMLTGLAKANCLIHFGAAEESLKQGTSAHVDLVDWSN